MEKHDIVDGVVAQIADHFVHKNDEMWWNVQMSISSDLKSYSRVTHMGRSLSKTAMCFSCGMILTLSYFMTLILYLVVSLNCVHIYKK